MMHIRLALTLCGAMAGIVLPLSAAAAPAPPNAAPLVTAAPKVGEMWAESPFDEGRYGMVEEEFFFEGTTSAGVTYKSRMIVRRPASARRFNGTVIVEWMNASPGHDLDADYPSVFPLMQREGYAYVGVSVQPNVIAFLLKRNPARYASLQLTDDQNPSRAFIAAFDVFYQAGQALRGKADGVDPLGGLKAKVLIAIGWSQSSDRLSLFVGRMAPVYDAALLHGGDLVPPVFPIPILKLNSENEAAGYYRWRGITNANYAYWEVPGTAHQPLEGINYSLAQLDAAHSPGFPRCPFPYQGAGGPVPIDPVLRAGVSYLERAVRTGTPLPNAPLIDMLPPPPSPAGAPAVPGATPPAGGRGNQAPRAVIQRDRHGNALGGIRMPQQEVPTGRNTPSTGCRVISGGNPTTLGTYPQFDAFDGGRDPQIDPADMVNADEPAGPKALYKDHQYYVSRFAKATDAVLKQGLILKFDADAMKRAARDSNVAR